MGKSLSVPPSAILGGLLILTSYLLSPTVIKTPANNWMEAALIWLTISMPTGSRKSTVYQFLIDLLKKVRQRVQCKGKECYLVSVDTGMHVSFLVLAEYPAYIPCNSPQIGSVC